MPATPQRRRRKRRKQRRSGFRWWYVVAPCAGVFGVLLLVTLLWEFRPSNARAQVSDLNMKQVGIALSNYHETFLVLPPGGVYDTKDGARHGWQTLLLPWIEQGQLYRQVDFHVPWTHARNRQLFQYRVPPYEIPGLEPMQNGYALSHIAGNVHVFSENSSVRFRDFIDGTGNTMLAGQVSAGFKPWGHPANWRDPAKGLKFDSETFGGPHAGGTVVLMVDGTTRVLSKDTDPEVLRKMGAFKRKE